MTVKPNPKENSCPRCGNTEFQEKDCGSDSYDNDVTWTSEVCTKCGLWHSGWTDKWLVGVDSWKDEEDAQEYIPKESGAGVEEYWKR